MEISSVRLTVPKVAAGELMRKRLVNTVLTDHRSLTYIHAGAGYGKTTRCLRSRFVRKTRFGFCWTEKARFSLFSTF